MPPPFLKYPEWFLRNVVDRKLMEELVNRVSKFYDNHFMEILYRAHHNSFKVSYADVFYNDFVNYVAKACGLKKKIFWRYLLEESTLRYMHERRKHFFRYLKKPPSKKKHHMIGDIKWSLDFWLSQLSFWYATVKSFVNVWARVVLNNEKIKREFDWDEAITLYIISDFVDAFLNSKGKCMRKKWRKKIKKRKKML